MNYQPLNPNPQEIPDLSRWVLEELQRIANTLTVINEQIVELQAQYADLDARVTALEP